MAIARWNPWNDLFDLHTQVDQLFQSLTDTPRSNGGLAEFSSLPVDIRQTENEFIIEASVPGFTPDEVEVTFEDGVLNIRGQHTQQSEAKGEYVRRERRQSSLFRQVGLPAEVRAEEIRAAFTNGVLEVIVPRSQKAQPKRIAVTVGSGKQPAPQVIEHTG